MKMTRRAWLVLLFAWLACSLGAPHSLAQTNSLVWRKTQDKVDADIRQFLGRAPIARARRGGHRLARLNLDPDAIHKVSAKFKNLSTGEALHSLLGNLNFVVVPQAHGASRLYVFRSSRQQATRLIASGSSQARRADPQ